MKPNFLTHKSIKKSRRRKKLVKVGIILGIFFLLFLIFIGYSLLVGKRIYGRIAQAKGLLSESQKAIEDQNFNKVTLNLEELKNIFHQSHNDLNKLKFWKIVPLINRQYKAASNLLIVGEEVSEALVILTKLADSVLSKINNEEVKTLAHITSEQKREILKILYEAPPDLNRVRAQLELALITFYKIPSKGLIKPLDEAIDPLRQNLPVLVKTINDSIPIIEALPLIAGYPQEKTYLFLLQNNNELRPTGGFIGTYGILKLKDGEITHFTTDNVYNLDNPVKDTLNTTLPWQMAQHLAIKKWFFRDSNWSPHFPESAEKALELYYLEGGKEKNFDGVVAITPTFIQSILTITGPVKVDSIEFNSENLIDILQYQVEKGYARAGIPESERKEIIGQLGEKILEAVFNLSKDKWPQLFQTVKDQIDQKQVLIYSKDPYLQSLIQKQNWAGEVKDYRGDFLMVIDTNLAALKTDRVMEREIEYSLDWENSQKARARVKITYHNKGKFTEFTTRYRTYTRVYVPLGSRLLKWEGIMAQDRSNKPGEVEVSNDLGKTYFGGFISIEPGESKYLLFEYELPDSVSRQLEKKNYNLLIEKQAGTSGHKLTVQLKFPFPIKKYSPLEFGQSTDKNKVIFNWDLKEDREFNISF